MEAAEGRAGYNEDARQVRMYGLSWAFMGLRALMGSANIQVLIPQAVTKDNCETLESCVVSAGLSRGMGNLLHSTE